MSAILSEFCSVRVLMGQKTYQLYGIAGCSHFRDYMYQELMNHYTRSIQTSVPQRREDVTSRRSDNQCALMAFQGQESWMQATKIALWTKLQWVRRVFD